eukprot:2932131-Rhodomonas_salina.2
MPGQVTTRSYRSLPDRRRVYQHCGFLQLHSSLGCFRGRQCTGKYRGTTCKWFRGRLVKT